MEDIIGLFLRITDSSRAPEPFRKWIAIGMVAACLGRRCYSVIREADGPFWPNFYILLVAEPGIGKSLQLRHARELMRRVPGACLGPDKITPERFLNLLAERSAEDGEAVMALFLNEFASLVKKEDGDMMEILTGLYDCPEEYAYLTFKRGEDLVTRACINILASTQPDWFGENFSIRTLGQGFPARLILVFSDEKKPVKYWQSYPRAEESSQRMVEALRAVTRLSGEFQWPQPSRELFQKLADDDFPPVPSDPLLEHYCTRRAFHIAKLSMVMAASRSRKLVVEPQDIKRAYSELLEIEKDMPKALAAAGGNAYHTIEVHAVRFVERHGGRVPESSLRRFLTKNVPPNMLDPIIDNLVLQNRLIAKGDVPGKRVYIKV